MDTAWRDVLACQDALTSLSVDLSLMLGKDGVGLDKVVEQRKVHRRDLQGKTKEIFQNLYRPELDDLFGEVRGASAAQIEGKQKQ